jgi:hypothetical protein
MSAAASVSSGRASDEQVPQDEGRENAPTSKFSERVYRTPRTYGSPTGYDHEVSHYPNSHARLAEAIAKCLCGAGGAWVMSSDDIAERSAGIAIALMRDWERRDWLIEIQDAPGMDKHYGLQKRGSATGEAA